MYQILLSAGYTLIEIQDEPTPLALLPGSDAGYFGTLLGVMTILIVLGVLVFYFIGCIKCRKRIHQLNGGGQERLGWNLRNLRYRVAEIEMEETEQLFRKNIKDFEPFFE